MEAVVTLSRERRRDIAQGFAEAEAVQLQHRALVESQGITLLGRVFHGSDALSPQVALAPADVQHDPALAPQPMIHLGSSDYAGLNRHPRVVSAAMQALRSFGNGSTGGRLLNGTTELHVALERRLARFVGMEDALTYNSGYCANLATLSTLCSPDDVVLTDILNHKSIVDGLRLGRAKAITYLHGCILGPSSRSAQGILQGLSWAQRKFIVTDGIFSVDGDVARLEEIVQLAREHNAYVIVDEAHAIGAFGPNGHGSVAAAGLTPEVDVITGVLSKGLPGVGGFVAGSKRTIDLLRYGSNAYIFSTSLPPSVVAGLIEAIDILEHDSSLQERLHRNAEQLRRGLVSLGLDILGSESAVIPVLMPDAVTAMRFTRLLHEGGVYVNVALHPAVSALRPRLRINVNAGLAPEDIELALAQFRRCAQLLGLGTGAGAGTRPQAA